MVINMQVAAMGFTPKTDRLPRPERFAAWVEKWMRDNGVSVGELAFKARVDKRDLNRLLTDRSMGWRLEDSLTAFFGYDLTDAVNAPVIGGDRLTLLERQLEQNQAEAAALHARVEREQRAFNGLDPAGSGLRVVDRETGARRPPMGRELSPASD